MQGVESYRNLQVFKNDQFGEIRVLSIGGEPWYVGTDVAGALGYKNTYQALNGHVDTEDKRLLRDMKNVVPYQNDIVQLAQYQNAIVPPSGVTLINESGLYALILTSKLPKAKAFKRWVTSEVLPTIRKQGFYNPSPQSPHRNPSVKIYFCKPRITENGNFQMLHFMWSDGMADYDFSDKNVDGMPWYRCFWFRGAVRRLPLGFARRYAEYRNKARRRER